MPGHNRLLVRLRPEVRQDEIIHHLLSRVHQRRIAGRAIVRNRALQHVPQAIQLVPPYLLGNRHPHRFAVALVIRVDVTIRLLSRDDLFDRRLRRLPQPRIILRLQSKRHALQPLVHVGVRVHRPLLRLLRLPHQTQEVIHPPVVEQLLVHRWNARLHIRLPPLRPEPILDRHRPHRNVVQLRVRRVCQIQNTLVPPTRSRRTRRLIKTPRTSRRHQRPRRSRRPSKGKKRPSRNPTSRH